jgi:hypothetical protein
MNHNRPSHIFCLAIVMTCLAGSPALAATEDTNDKVFINCTFKHRDTTLNTDGSFKRAYMSGNKNSASGNTTGDLRLYDATSQTRTRFSMTWKDFSGGKNRWYISPDKAQKCMQGLNKGVNAKTCSEFMYVYLTADDGYLVISDLSSGGGAWKAPTDSNGTGYLTSATFSATAALSERKRFHWGIRDCQNLIGEFKTPAP